MADLTDIREDPAHNLWKEALGESLCAAYSGSFAPRAWPILRINQLEYCTHDWCHGVIDVWNRVFGNNGAAAYGAERG